MPYKHPIIAVTGSSGAGTTSVQHAFAEIFRRLDVNVANVRGDAFYRYNRDEMSATIDTSIAIGRPVSHFGPDVNLFAELQELFREYSATGTGKIRHYANNNEEAARYQIPIGEFSPWRSLPENTDLLFYEGLHGGVVASTWTRRRPNPAHHDSILPERRQGNNGVDAAQFIDLLIGVVPVINLEWIQKIYHDCEIGTDDHNEVTTTVLRRMHDYINIIVPQFSITDINFQRVPTVDTSNPFEIQEVPSADQSVVVIHFRDPKRHDFPSLMKKIGGAFMSRPNTMVVPGGVMAHALEVICSPIIQTLISAKHTAQP